MASLKKYRNLIDYDKLFAQGNSNNNQEYCKERKHEVFRENWDKNTVF